MKPARIFGLAGLIALSVLTGGVQGQPQADRFTEPEIHNVIVPQVRRHVHHAGAVQLVAVAADVRITGQVATTSLKLSLTNPARGPQEAQLLLPVPDGVTVRSVQYDGTGPEPVAKILPRDEARRIYDSIVNRSRDPALVEFAGYNLIRTSAFPVPAGQTQNVTLTFEQVLTADGDRIDYLLPRSESLAENAVRWTVNVSIDDGRGVAAVYSPSHDLAVDRRTDTRVDASTPAGQPLPPGAFRLSYLRRPADPTTASATLMAYPDAAVGDGGGYFLLLAKLPRPAELRQTRAREVTVVIDRSGSMAGEKIAQARKAALQVIDGLAEGEAFNIIDYSDSIASFSKVPVEKTPQSAAEARAYIEKLEASGGTNIHDALIEAVRPAPKNNRLPVVLFLTDGLPTIGERVEVAIREAVRKANMHNRRIFSFGVGYDVNAPLLSTVSTSSRATATMVLPGEDVEQKVSQVYQRLRGPQLLDPRLIAVDERGAESTRTLREVVPVQLNDVFDNDEIMVLGQYTGGQVLRFRLTGHSPSGDDRSFEFSFPTESASPRNGYVPRIWATRKIAALTEQLRQAAVESGGSQSQSKELIDEIVRLSSRWGVMTEYTSFLATDEEMPLASFEFSAGSGGGGVATPGDIAPSTASAAQANVSLRQKQRSGADAVAQQENYFSRLSSLNVASTNRYRDEAMNEALVSGVQNVADRTLFRRGGRWVDSVLGGQENTEPEVTIAFGSPEYSKVVEQLAREGRQGLLAMSGDVYIYFNGKRTLITAPDDQPAK